MKSESGITLTSLVIYVIVLSILVGTLALISTFFFQNVAEVKEQEKYAPEFNKFAMFFLKDVKNNRNATVVNESFPLDANEGTTYKISTVTFEDGNIYKYDSRKKQIYRNETVITEEVQDLNFGYEQTQINNTIKNIIVVDISLGDKKVLETETGETTERDKIFSTQMRFVLKYW